MRLLAPAFLTLALPLLLVVPSASLTGCGSKCAWADYNCDQVPDDLGVPVYDASGEWAKYDANGDGMTSEGYGIDEDGDGRPDGVALDTDGDGFYDAIDYDGDGIPDRRTGDPPKTGSGGAGPGAGGTPGTGGAPPGSGGSPGGGGQPPGVGGTPPGGSGGTTPGGGGSGPNLAGSCLTASPRHSGASTTTDQYYKGDTWRQNCADTATCPVVPYKFIANGWGDNWQSHNITFAGTKFTVNSFNGTQGQNYAPAGYPTVFCGLYSNEQSGNCGLPAAISSLTEIDTGLRWKAGTQGSDYNVAYDIWMGNGNNFASYLMVWYRDPPNAQPAGSVRANNVFVGDDPKRWDVWAGSVNGAPIVNYVRPPGEESYELAFDALDFVEHAKANYQLPGDTVLSVAIGFEIWNGPVAGLEVEDFCVEVH